MAPDSAHRQELIEELAGLFRKLAGQAFARGDGPGGKPAVPVLHHFALHAILRSGGVTQTELAKFLGVTAGHVTGVVDRLEEEGLVRRVRDRIDRRRIHLEALHRAHRFHMRLHHEMAGNLLAGFDRWTDEELEVMVTILRRLEERPPGTAHPTRSGATTSRRTSGRSARPAA